MATLSEKEAAKVAARFINDTRQHVFLTGKAGTGKTTFLRSIILNTHKKTMVAAPTGIAAINAGGVTLHSLFNLPFGAFIPTANYVPDAHSTVKVTTPYSLVKDMQMNLRKRKLFQEMELLVIDEVSMLRADLLDAIDTVLRYARRNQQRAFGGVQVLFIGDLLQLPPVVRDEEWRILEQHYPSVYFFDAKVLRENKPVYIELDKIYRQSDPDFVSLLNHLRENRLTKADIDLLNTYYKPDFEPQTGDGFIRLTTHNNKADQQNKQEIQKLTTKSYFYKATVEGEFPEFSYPIENILELKKGAQVMFVKNDSAKQRYFNGKIGTIEHISENTIEVGFPDGSSPVEVERYQWENKRFTLNETTNEIEENIVGKFIQYPLKLAWAITVHKSQGLTFDKAIIDVAGAFAPGQMYVALSRLTSLNGLVLSSPIRNTSLQLDSSVSQFAASKENEERLGSLYEKESHGYFKTFVLHSFDLGPLASQIQVHISSYNQEELKPKKKKYHGWATKLLKEVEEVKLVADKFIGQLHTIFDAKSEDYLITLYDRVSKAKTYFEPHFKGFSQNLLSTIKAVEEEKKVKGYLEELNELERQFFRQWQQITKAHSLLKARAEKTDLSKETVSNTEILEDRKKQLEESITLSKVKKEPSESKEKKPKAPKGQSQEHSFAAFMEGKTIDEIADERSMAPGTIESHLAQFVAAGKLQATRFVEESKIEKIIQASLTINSTLFGELRQALGEEYSYSEIKFAMAHFSFLNGEKIGALKEA